MQAPTFPILSHAQLIQKISNFDAIKYARSRNHLSWWVSQLSPYITHWVITIDEIVRISLQRYTLDQAQKRYQELLRREYFLQAHYHKWGAIFHDMELDKTKISKHDILPSQISDKTFGSKRVNQAIFQLETTWRLHNHVRMRLASYMSHYQKLYWLKLADRTYYHFLDGELGPNHLSWQWVQSTFAWKAYIMNEENFQKYSSITDPIFRWSYEDVSNMLFDPKRISPTVDSIDIHDTLSSDLSKIVNYDYTQSIDQLVILTPRDLHQSKTSNPQNTICLLDIPFMQAHPRSPKRVQRVQDYCTHYNITLYQWDLHTILKHLTMSWAQITMYETRNPSYHETQLQYRSDINLIKHPRCSPVVTQWYVNKFFEFWKKTLPHLQDLESCIHAWV